MNLFFPLTKGFAGNIFTNATIDQLFILSLKYNKKLKHCWYMNRKKYL